MTQSDDETSRRLKQYRWDFVGSDVEFEEFERDYPYEVLIDIDDDIIASLDEWFERYRIDGGYDFGDWAWVKGIPTQRVYWFKDATMAMEFKLTYG